MIRKRADTNLTSPIGGGDSNRRPDKKSRVEGEESPSNPSNTDNNDIPKSSQLPGLRTALDIQRAMNELHWIPEIGICPLKEQRPEETILYCSSRSYNEKPGRERPRKASKSDTEVVLNFLKIQAMFPAAYRSGILDSSFQLTITLPDYAFGDTIKVARHTYYSTPAGVSSRLEAWFDHSQTSGFGDVRDQVTKVDEEVRMAREIRSDSFTVEPKLLDEISKHWKDHFFPSSVRVEPYKIHLYGPGGHFKPHRDTPQKDLVGTFLVGLGDTTETKNLVVDGHSFNAHPGSWVAFYPDVPHEVTEIDDGYRAVLAFKIFRAPDSSISEGNVLVIDGIPPALRSAAEKLVSSLEAPFGLILDRKYCLGTTALSGLDANLHAYANARQDITVQLIPIVTETSVFDHFMPAGDKEDRTAQIITSVKPFTYDIIDHVLKRKRDSTVLDKWKEVENVLFYDLHNEDSSVKWSSSAEEINHTGNEADATREDSLYLSYALVCLPLSSDYV